jgi:ubiquinone/menaquinone biosynthesis C-methylase UbiE
MLYRMAEVCRLVRQGGFRGAVEEAYRIRLDEIRKSWLWPNRIVTVLFGLAYFLLLYVTSMVLPTRKPPARLHNIIRELSGLYYYIPEMVIFKSLELDAAAGFTYPGRGLDVGCGNGLTGAALVATVGIAELHGIDRSQYFARVPAYASYLVGDALHLPYADDSFDFVISFGVIDHIEELDQLLAEICRVLRRRGTLTFAIQTKLFRQSTFWYRVFSRLGFHKKATEFQMFRDVYDMIFHYLTEDEWRERLVRGGFREVSISYVFGADHLCAYDLLNMQTYFLRFFFAEKAQRFLAAHSKLQRWVVKATERIASFIVAKPATRENATRYFIRATK